MTNNNAPDRVYGFLQKHKSSWNFTDLAVEGLDGLLVAGPVEYTPAATHDALKAKYDKLEQTAIKHADERSRTISALQTGQAALAAKLAQVEAERDAFKDAANRQLKYTQVRWEERQAARAENAVLREAILNARECVGGDCPSNGMSAPEDVWGILTAALQLKDNADE